MSRREIHRKKEKKRNEKHSHSRLQGLNARVQCEMIVCTVIDLVEAKRRESEAEHFTRSFLPEVYLASLPRENTNVLVKFRTIQKKCI